MTTKGITLAVAAVLAVALAGTFATRQRDGALAAAHDSLTVALRDGARARDFTALLIERGQAAEARADSADRRADSLARVSVKSAVRYATVRATAPDTCRPVLAAADSALADAQAEAEVARAGLRIAQDATNDYRAAVDTLVPALTRLRAAASAVDHAARPGLIERLTPRLGFGAAAGVDAISRRPAVVVGVTLGWAL